jgi:hypothetical protein
MILVSKQHHDGVAVSDDKNSKEWTGRTLRDMVGVYQPRQAANDPKVQTEEK